MNITLSDLWQSCSACGGAGKAAPKADAGAAVPVPAACPTCKGKKGQPTPSGEAILALLQRANFVIDGGTWS